jgi:hypothetical protein
MGRQHPIPKSSSKSVGHNPLPLFIYGFYHMLTYVSIETIPFRVLIMSFVAKSEKTVSRAPEMEWSRTGGSVWLL